MNVHKKTENISEDPSVFRLRYMHDRSQPVTLSTIAD